MLDAGCGEGSNAILLAKLGAQVTGIDVSPKSVQLAERRAELNGVADRTRFICSPLEAAALPDNAFDVIWGDGILHHVIPVLGPVLERLIAAAKDGAQVIFSEPVARVAALRRFRLKLPIHTDATPDERPLDNDELALVDRYLPGLARRSFGLLGRFGRFVVLDNSFETSSRLRKLAAEALVLADYAVLSLPRVELLGSAVVMHGAIRKR